VADNTSELYGVLAAFSEPQQLREAIQHTRAAGFCHLEAFTPFPVEGLSEALGIRTRALPLIVLIGFLAGAAGIYALQYYSAVVAYPVNIGGRPFNSWPVFLMVSFAVGILGGALGAFLGMLAINGLPRYHHPVFSAENFSLAQENAFYLCVEASDPHFDRSAVTQHLAALRPYSVSEVYNA